jgi:RNA polymerase sigma factor (sigma-70 family)
MMGPGDGRHFRTSNRNRVRAGHFAAIPGRLAGTARGCNGGPMNRILNRLTRAAVEPSPEADNRLLDAFVAERSEPAFASLVERHGPMVLAVCSRVLRNHHDAEDAFQATFLILARRAGDVNPRGAVGAWLYGVAYRVAIKARALRSRRLVREQPLGDEPVPAAESPEPGLAEAIDRALGSLPVAYRAAVVACDLEGLSRAEAAVRLGWKEGTLSGRLARARELLAHRLRRAGVTLPAGGLPMVIGTGDLVAADLATETVRLAVGSSGKNLISGVSAPVAALTEGVVRGMVASKLKTMVVAGLLVVALGVGAWGARGLGTGSGPGDNPGGGSGAAPPAAADKKPAEKRHPDLEAMQGTWWILAIGEGEKAKPVDPNIQRDPRQFAVTIRDDRFIFSRHPAFNTIVGVGTITLQADKKPKQIVIVHEAGRLIGDYEFVAPKPKDEVVQLRLTLGPDKFAWLGLRADGSEWVEVILGRYADPKRDPASDADLGAGAKLDLTAAMQRHDLVYQELQIALREFENRKPAKNLAAFEEQLQRDQNRINQIVQLLDQAEVELVKARLKAKPAPKLPAATDPNMPDLLKEAAARREIERQRAQVLLEAERRKVAAAQDQKDSAQRSLFKAERNLAEALESLTAAQKEYDDLFGEKKPAPTIETRDDKGERIPFSEDAAKQLTDLVETMLVGSRGELGPLTGGQAPAFATAERWQQLQKTGHVVIRFPSSKVFKKVAGNPEVEVTDILVPVSSTRAPDFIFTRSGDTYRAFFDFPADKAKSLQQLVSTLAK